MEWRGSIIELFDNTADGAWVSDPAGRILYWNRAAEAILGYRAAQVAGRLCADVFCGRDGKGNRICGSPCPIKTLAHGGDLVEHFDMATRTRTGEPLWIDVSCISLPSTAGEAPATVHLFRDVTAARQIELLVRRQLAQSRPAAGGDDSVADERLTRREREVVALLRTGATTAAIARKLFISRATVRNHIQNILGKLQVHTRLEAVACVSRMAQQRANGLD